MQDSKTVDSFPQHHHFEENKLFYYLSTGKSF